MNLQIKPLPCKVWVILLTYFCMNRKFYIGLSAVAVVVVVAIAVGAQSRLFKGDWSGVPLSYPVSATQPLSYGKPLSSPVNPGSPAWSTVKLTKNQVVKASSSGQTILEPETLPLNDLSAGNQQPWIKRIQFAYLIEKMIGYIDAKPVSFSGCNKQTVADLGTPRLYGLNSSVASNVVCFVVSKGIMPTLNVPTKNSFYGGQNISRVVAAGMLQRAFDPTAESQKPPNYYDLGGMPSGFNTDKWWDGWDGNINNKSKNHPMYTDVAPYMWSVYWLTAVGGSDVEPWSGKAFRPYDSLTIPEAMDWLSKIYTYMPKENWPKW